MLNLIFLAITLFFVARGVSGGIEKVAVYLMPLFFVLLVGITIYSLIGGASQETFDYLFTFEPEKLTGEVMLALVTHEGPEAAVDSALRILEGSDSLTAPPLVLTILDT